MRASHTRRGRAHRFRVDAEPGQLTCAVAVGRVTSRGACIWMRSPHDGRHRIELWQMSAPQSPVVAYVDTGDRSRADHTFAFFFPDDCEGGRPLEPSTRYRFRMVDPHGAHVGEGRFETFPQDARHAPSRFTFGFGSCHQPYDEDGTLRPKGTAMLKATRAAFEETGVKFALWLGDQMYADFPERQSLFCEEGFRRAMESSEAKGIFECSTDEALRAYHHRYRWGWAQPEWRALMAEWPSYVMLDDHEVIDNFGSFPEHNSPRFDCIRAGALEAYEDYQGCRMGLSNATGALDWKFDYGPVAFYALDVRTQRRAGADARIFNDVQLAAVESWLASRADAPILFLACSVPLFFMPGWAAELITHFKFSEFSGDGFDRWSHPQYDHERVQLLELLRAHQQRNPRQKVVVLAGDVHVGYALRCDWRVEEGVQMHQLVSSPLTHLMDRPQWGYARHVPRMYFRASELKGPAARLHLMGGLTARFMRQPVADLNVGVVDVDLTDPAGAAIRFRLFGVDDDERPKVLFDVEF